MATPHDIRKRIDALPPDDREELDRLLSAPLTFQEFVDRVHPGFEWYRAQQVIAEALEEVARGRIKRLMIFMPPQEGKSLMVSKLFPAYFLHEHPTKWVGVGSYSFLLAKEFSRDARMYYREQVADFSDEASAVEMWATARKGGLWAVGRGGSATGRPAHLFVVDDPLKDRNEAESETIRKTLHDWYNSVVRMRLQPQNAVVVVHCMTGDTAVLLADGTDRPLRDIRPGDSVATYDRGMIGISRVKNWKNQGPDCIFAIKTSGGVVVRANARHPLLIDRGNGAEWVKVSDLRIGDRALRVIGASGAENSALSMGARNRPSAADIAPRTTTKHDGLLASGLLPSILRRGAAPTYDTVTALAWTTTAQCGRHKAGDVPSAANLHTTTGRSTGPVECCALTTIREQVRSEHCSATIAILPLGTGKPKRSCSGPRSTCAIIPDPIVEIADAGYEDVFDIEVEGTENFIANGLVSHNTRWHEDDLSGHLLELEKTSTSPEHWHVIELPGIAEPPEERPKYAQTVRVLRDWRRPGEPLGGRYTIDRYRSVLANAGDREFESQIQQRPSAAAGTILKRAWWKRITEDQMPLTFDRTIISVDCTFKDTDGTDFVAIHVYGRIGPRVYGRYRIKDRMSFTTTVDTLRVVMKQFPQAVVYVEDKANGSAVIDTLSQTLLSVIPVNPEGGKIARAYACQGDVQHGRVYLPEGEGWDEMIRECASFPSGLHDDDVDGFTQAMAVYREELRDAMPTKEEVPVKRDDRAVRWDHVKRQPIEVSPEEAFTREMGLGGTQHRDKEWSPGDPNW